jgi:hypothetical protein
MHWVGEGKSALGTTPETAVSGLQTHVGRLVRVETVQLETHDGSPHADAISIPVQLRTYGLGSEALKEHEPVLKKHVEVVGAKAWWHRFEH